MESRPWESVTVGQVSLEELSSSRHMYVKAQTDNTTLITLIDTGASGFAFISERICNQLKLIPSILKSPLALVGFEGKSGAQITKTLTFSLAVGRHREKITAFVTPNMKYDLVLGLPWLEEHNPYVNWTENTITFGETCMQKACCQFETTIPYVNAITDLSSAESYAQKGTPIQPPEISKENYSSPIQVSAIDFFDLSQKPENSYFALSIRDLDLLLDPCMQREPTVQINNASICIPKNADPEQYLPAQYHDFLDVFDRKQANTLPPHRPWDHSIDLQPGKQPPAAHPYSMNQNELKALREYLDQELSKGFIRISKSPAAAPVLFVKKPNGDLRFCIDYRGLNAISVKNRCSLPLISETLCQLSHAKYYTKLDIISAFNKLRIKKGDEWKAAFTCRYGLFEPLVLPFGLCNGPASFQTYINHALRGLLDDFCTAFMDDILIYSATLADHRKHVREVLQRLREHGLQVDVSKCAFETTSVTYLGLIVSTEGISMDPKKVACVQEWPKPRSVRDIQGFLGFANFYRRFIPEFSRLATPLTRLTKKDVKFIWNQDCEESFRKIKSAFQEGTMLAHFDPQRQTILETDASDYVTAAILSQYDDKNILRPVAFMSKKMLPAECNYEIFDKELLAIVNAFETWSSELGSVEDPILILSDHKNLEYFTTTKKLNRRQARWSELLADFNFRIVFRPGKQGGKPDALTRISSDKPSGENDDRTKYQQQILLKPQQIISRIATSDPIALFPMEEEHVEEPLLENWAKHCEADKFCQEIRAALGNPESHRNDIQLASCASTESSFSLNGKEYVPSELRQHILKFLHENPLHGHRGAAALYALLSRSYWWPNCHKDCVKYAKGCEDCQRNNPSVQKPYGFLQPLPAPQAAFRHLTLDFVGPLPICKIRGFEYRFILQVVDRLTKRVWIMALERPTARETAEAFLNNVIRFAGLPDSLISDQGRAFIDGTWKEICSRLQINHKLSTSYHPETDGQTERANKTLEIYLKHYVNYHQDDWAHHLALAEFCCNNHVNSSTGVSPFFASFGHHPRLDFRPESEIPSLRQMPEFVDRMKKIIQQCHDSMTLAQAFQATYANEKRLPAPRYQVGDHVYLSLKNLHLSRPSKKLDHVRAGPWRIISMKTPLVAKLDLPTQSKIDNNFHVSLLRPAHFGYPSQNQETPPPLEIAPSGHEVHEVEAILDSRIRRKKVQYLVRWTGTSDTTWEPYEHLDNCRESLFEFHKAYPNAPRSTELAI